MAKEPWKEWGHIWPTKAKFMAWLRGGIRRACWNRSPIKHEVIKRKRKRVINPDTGNEVWGGTCYICKEDFVQSKLQVDHIVGEYPLKEISDIQSFVEAMTCLSEDDLDLICEPCHKIKSLAERNGITFKEAVMEKKIIAFKKLDSTAQLRFMRELGIETKPTIKARVEEYRKYLEEGEK
jgi:5-methylcytosine-specific restriction endonuclease McrA